MATDYLYFRGACLTLIVLGVGAITARHAKYKAPHYMTYMTYMTYYKQLAFAVISPVTFLCDFSWLVAAASYDEADVSADVSAVSPGW